MHTGVGHGALRGGAECIQGRGGVHSRTRVNTYDGGGSDIAVMMMTVRITPSTDNVSYAHSYLPEELGGVGAKRSGWVLVGWGV